MEGTVAIRTGIGDMRGLSLRRRLRRAPSMLHDPLARTSFRARFASRFRRSIWSRSRRSRISRSRISPSHWTAPRVRTEAQSLDGLPSKG